MAYSRRYREYRSLSFAPETTRMARIDDPDLVRSEYTTADRLAARFRVLREWHLGLPIEEALLAWACEDAPRRVLEVGCGDGRFSAMVRDRCGASVTAADLSPGMVALAGARGLDAVVADVQDLPFDDGTFDVAVACWMLYHAPDLAAAVAELARVVRPGGRLVACTMGYGMVREVWDLVDDGDTVLDLSFNEHNGEQVLGAAFDSVRRHEIRGHVRFPDRDAVVDYMRATLTRAHLAERLPMFDGPFDATTHTVVYVATRAGEARRAGRDDRAHAA